MLARERDQFFRFLSEVAGEITKHRAIPIDVLELCSQLGVRIARHPDAKKKALLIQAKSGPEIRLPSNTSVEHRMSPFERFLVAHELGHYLLAQKFSAAPLGKSEYWQHEALCDWFASILLLPDNLIRDSFSDSVQPREILYLIRNLAQKAQAPEPSVAKRLCEVKSGIAIFQVARKGNEAFQIVQTALPEAREIGRKISPSSKIGRALSTLSYDHIEVELGGAVFEEDVIPSCKGAQEGFAVLQPSLRINVAISGCIN